ncbi:MAG TPA: type II and III secretion system protein family protein [Acetobacteraceae bacterium]|nr:type II and III secretion system protein family protein [Acetobacteraceae bacterium]
MRLSLIPLALVLLLAAGSQGNATAAATPAAPTTPPAASSTPTRSVPLTLTAGRGVLLALPQPAATIMSADPSVARAQPASPDSVFLMAVAPGVTTVIATNSAGAAIVQYDVLVNGAAHPEATGAAPGPAASGTPSGITAGTAAAAQAAIAQSVQGAQDVRVRAAGTELVLSGTVPTAYAGQQANAIARGYAGEKGGVVDNLTVLGSIQVNVRVRIAEISRQITRQLGFNWQALGAGNGWQFGLHTGQAAVGLTNPLIPLGLAALSGAPTPSQLGAGFFNKNWDVNNIVDALAADSLITMLAEPNLTALSGETASFLAGGEFPVPVAGNGSNGTIQISVDFKQFGVSLALVPTVLSPDRLNLRIRPEVSQLSSNGAVSVPVGSGTLTIPALTVRRAETTVELGSGQSFAIAGLLQHTSSDATNALPGFGEVPVIGALFKSNDFQRGESELVIIVTPYIVQPTSSPAALHLPTDGFRPATDLDRILFGRQMAPGVASGLDAGFVLK